MSRPGTKDGLSIAGHVSGGLEQDLNCKFVGKIQVQRWWD